MCRIITVIVLLASVCSVIATSCMNKPEIKGKRSALKSDFATLVNNSLHLTTSINEHVAEFEQKLRGFYDDVNKTCKMDFNLNITRFIDLVEFSLRNNTFKEFMEDKECFKKAEKNISLCVKHKVGFFNLTSNKTHSSWYSKLSVRYDDKSCSLSQSVKNCVDLSACKPYVSQYVASLFDFTLKNCPEPKKKATSKKAPMLSEPAIITLSVGAVLLMQVKYMLQGYVTP